MGAKHIAFIFNFSIQYSDVLTLYYTPSVLLLVNRVENQNEPKRPRGGGRLGSFWFSTRPTAMGALIIKQLEYGTN